MALMVRYLEYWIAYIILMKLTEWCQCHGLAPVHQLPDIKKCASFFNGNATHRVNCYTVAGVRPSRQRWASYNSRIPHRTIRLKAIGNGNILSVNR